MRFVVAFVFAVLACANAYGQTLWHGIPAGATVEQVHEKLPAATDIVHTLPCAPACLNQQPTVSPHAEFPLLEYKGFQLAGLDFKATFFFKDGRLVNVRLEPLQNPEGDEASSAAGKLNQSLTAKYGKPLEETDSAIWTVGYDMKWATNGVLIYYSFYKDGDTGHIRLTYVAPQDGANL